MVSFSGALKPERTLINMENSLNEVRRKLIRLEDTIIFALIERAQYKLNAPIYHQELAGLSSGGLPLLDYALKETEKMNARVGRYMGQIDVAFFPDLPGASLFIPKIGEFPIQPNHVNLNRQVRNCYSEEIIPFLCKPGDDQHYWESCVTDVQCLQAFSQRIHYGKVVAEVKYRDQKDVICDAVKTGDRQKVMQLITDSQVEQKVIERIRQKASYYGCFPEDLHVPTSAKIDPEVVAMAYQRWVIPFTKEVECDYLFEVVKD